MYCTTAKLSSEKWKNSSFTKEKSLVGLPPGLEFFSEMDLVDKKKKKTLFGLKFNLFGPNLSQRLQDVLLLTVCVAIYRQFFLE